MVEVLLVRGVRVDRRDMRGRIVLIYVVIGGYERIVGFLFCCGVDFNVFDDVSEMFYLFVSYYMCGIFY